MKRFLLTLAVLALGSGAAMAATAATRPSATSGRVSLASVRGTYDPFAMQRAAQAPAGAKENDDFRWRQEVVKWCKDKVKPPKPVKHRSPHKPGDDDGNNGHGNDDDHDDDSNPGQGGGNHGTGHDNDNGHHNDQDKGKH